MEVFGVPLPVFCGVKLQQTIGGGKLLCASQMEFHRCKVPLKCRAELASLTVQCVAANESEGVMGHMSRISCAPKS